MICKKIKHLLCQNLIGQCITDLIFNELSEDFQRINEYDSIDISFQSNRILRVQCALRILYNNELIFLSNNRFLFNSKDKCDEKYLEFQARLKEISLIITNTRIIDITFTEIGDISLSTNTGFEFQLLIDTRRTDCTSYDIWDFDTKTVLCVFCEDGIIKGKQNAI